MKVLDCKDMAVGTRDSFSMSDLTDSDMKNIINVLEADILDSINVSNQSFIFQSMSNNQLFHFLIFMTCIMY